MIQRASTMALLAAKVASCLAAAAVCEEPKPDPKARIAFRWLEGRSIKGVTEIKGIQTTCGDELSYPHLQPILTHRDVATARVRRHDLARTGLPSPQFDVVLQLTPQAIQKLADASGNASCRELAVFVDGEYWGTTFFRKSSMNEFVPTAGNSLSRGWAKRVVAACMSSDE